MLVIITKTNSDYGHTFRNFTTIETLFNYVESCGYPVILLKNWWYNEPIEVIIEAYQTSKEDAEKIQKIEWEIEIYNADRE